MYFGKRGKKNGRMRKKIASKLAVSQACFSFGDNIVHNLTSETVANRLEVIINYVKWYLVKNDFENLEESRKAFFLPKTNYRKLTKRVEIEAMNQTLVKC